MAKMSTVKKINADVCLFAGKVITSGTAQAPKNAVAPLRGAAMQSVQVLDDAAVVIRGGKILDVGPRKTIEAAFAPTKKFNFPGKCITAGLVDCHTHLVFAGERSRDFYERIGGVSYEAIAARGGGILDSVAKMRGASRDDLIESSLKRLKQLLSHGVTTCEIKSGYGLDLDTEIKTLEVVAELKKMQPIDLVPTFLGAHEFPTEYRSNRQGYIDLLCEKILPAIAKKKLAVFCDIFCEKNVFDREASSRILLRAKDLGFALKLHVDELAENFGGAELAAELQAVSADHLVMTSDAGILALAQSQTVAVLLPATTFFLAKDRFARARAMIDAGCAVALASDLNPGSSNTESLQVVATLAAIKLKMSPAEILNALTHNAACAISRQHQIGRIAKGLQADLVIWDLSSHEQLPYHFGGNRVFKVFKKGHQVYSAT